jgi:hypothetical protein
MPRGGRRAGAGRKPKGELLRFIDGNAGRRRRRAQPAEPPSVITPAATAVEPPARMTAEELAIWHEWAPLAVQAGTLTPATAAAFEQLCQTEADRRQLRARFTRRQPVLGETEMAFRREHRALVRELNARLKDFCLAPFGKQLPGAAPEAEDDPLDKFLRRGQ